jgi:predicted protein tyrosine phosphatase
MAKRFKVLCICEHGNVRSVALAYLIKTIYGHDALACGMRETGDDTKSMLLKWAEIVIVLDEQISLDLMKWKDEHKCHRPQYLLDVGPDVWHDARHQELQHKLLKELNALDL